MAVSAVDKTAPSLLEDFVDKLTLPLLEVRRGIVVVSVVNGVAVVIDVVLLLLLAPSPPQSPRLKDIEGRIKHNDVSKEYIGSAYSSKEQIIHYINLPDSEPLPSPDLPDPDPPTLLLLFALVGELLLH